MNLKDLLSKYAPSLDSGKIKGITSDSREVKPGTVFVAVHGGSQDGHKYLHQAEQSGAVLLVGEKDSERNSVAPYVQVKDSREFLGQLASAFYGNPSEKLCMIGVTGTCGKTTTTYLLESILTEAGKKVGVIGTVDFRFGKKVYPSTHTTPGAVELQKLLAEMCADGCDAVVMEVSSHALRQKRVEGILFDGAIFTNLSPEHLDFHPDMEDYFQAKSVLFEELLPRAKVAGKPGVAAINSADSYGARLAKTISSEKFGNEKFEMSLEGIRGECAGVQIDSKLMGHFNGENIAGAVHLARALGIAPATVQRGISKLQIVPGRLENVGEKGIVVLVDYAHKPDALDKVLEMLQKIAQKKIITVFGCGGDRDRTKRPKMGKIAAERSTDVIVTSDNPRSEDPLAIIEEIKVGLQGYSGFVIEPDRRKAIFRAIDLAQKGDVVLIAGKGHEDYQIIKDGDGTKKVHFDDREVAREALLRKI